MEENMYKQPMLNYRFRVLIEKHVVSFMKVSGLNRSVETEMVPEGGYSSMAHIMEIPAKSPKTLRLEGGIYKEKDALLNRLLPGMYLEQGVVVTVLGLDGTEEAVYVAENTFVTKWELSELNAESGQVLVNSFEIAYTNIKRMK